MKITNVLNLPQPIVDAVTRQEGSYDRGPAEFSVTDLVNPPQITYLTRLHQDNLIEDASHRIWLLLGNAIHAILENAHDVAGQAESRLYASLEGVKISGQFDHLGIDDIILTDYKVTSAYAVKGDEVKPEWVKQLNYYRWLCLENDIPVDELQITAILRDWNKHGLRDESYPRQSVVNLDVPVWKVGELLRELTKDIEEHAEAMNGNPRPCTDAERWCHPGKVALMKKGRKSAVKLFDTLAEAKTWVSKSNIASMSDGKHYLEERPTIYKRCEDYCSVAEFCPQLKEEANG